MKVFIHSRPWEPGEYVANLFRDYLKDEGHDVYHQLKNDPQLVPNTKFDLAFGWGCSSTLAYVRDQLKVPTLVFDLGMIKRVIDSNKPGYFRVGIQTEKWINPTKDIPSDRWQAMNLPIRNLANTDGEIAFMGQVPGDVSHGMNEEQLLEWTFNKILRIRKLCNNKIVYRPHPLTTHRPLQQQFWTKLRQNNITIDETTNKAIEDLPLRDFKCVFTFCSTSGVHFIINGIPVISSSTALYSDLTEDIESDIWSMDFVATEKERVDWLSKICYSQWNQTEISNGTMWKHYEQMIRDIT